MSFVITDPNMVGAAADELQGIGSALAATNTAAAAPTAAVLPPATDSVSARIAALMDVHAQQYQALSAQAEAFHNQFVQTLIAAQNSYAETEASNTAAMQLTSATSPTTQTSSTNIALIMGGTDNPTPDPAYVTAVYNTYIASNPQYAGYTAQGLYTPEQFWPITGLTDQTFGQSVRQGVTILDNAIFTETGAGHQVLVVGYSQSATIATLEMRYLDALPLGMRPDPSLLNFMLLSDPNVPATGILTHYIPGFGAFNVLTPVDTLYQTSIYTLQYDPIAYFPRSIFNIPADLNALLGFHYLHDTYPTLSAAQLASAIETQIGQTTYYLIPTANLPLLDPLRMIPFFGNPLADLLQPFVRPFVDFGYATGLPGPFQSIGSLAVAGGTSVGAGVGIPSPLFAGLTPESGFRDLTSALPPTG